MLYKKKKVESAKNILGLEDDGRNSDAICQIDFLTEKKETKNVRSLNPDWNEVYTFPINIASEQVQLF